MAAENVNLVTRAFHFKGAPLYQNSCPSHLQITGYVNLQICNFISLFFVFFAEVFLINAKIFLTLFGSAKYFGIYENYFSKNTKNKEIKLQICKFTEPVICR